MELGQADYLLHYNIYVYIYMYMYIYIYIYMYFINGGDLLTEGGGYRRANDDGVLDCY